MSLEETMQNEIIEKVRKSGAKNVKLAVVDIDGVLRGKYVSLEKFESAAKSNFGFCNVIFGWDINDLCYNNSDYTGWHSGYPDAMAQIDLNTLRLMPWENDQPFFLCDLVDDKNQPLSVCPRQLLKSVIKQAQQMGYYPNFGMEFEWFNFSETAQSLEDKKYVAPQPITPGMFGYSLIRAGQNQDFFCDILDLLRKFDVPIEGLHTETGPGVYEAAIEYSNALQAADRAILFKLALKIIGKKYNIMPSFIAKWNMNLPGCSGHMHQSLADNQGRNVFHDDKDPLKMSETFKSYLAGQLLLLPDLLPFYAPTVNSYKRLVEGHWAPTRATWGVDNRTAALRVIPGSAKSTRLETRVSGSDVNPYLSIAAAIASGLYGIKNNLQLKEEAVIGSAYLTKKGIRLASNLGVAAEKLAKSKHAGECLNPDFLDHFVKTRHWEWQQYENCVTDWEIKRYFEII